jgi:hypothetical protein
MGESWDFEDRELPPLEAPALVPPGRPPRTALATGELPPPPEIPRALAEFVAAGAPSSVAAGLRALMLTLGVLPSAIVPATAWPSARSAIDGAMLVNSLILVALIVVGPALALSVVRVRRVLRAGYDRPAVAQFLAGSSAPMGAGQRVRLPYWRRAGAVWTPLFLFALWGLTFQIIPNAYMPGVFRVWAIALTVVGCVAEWACFRAPRDLRRARAAQAAFWRTTTLARALFRLASWGLPGKSGRRAPRPRAA